MSITPSARAQIITRRTYNRPLDEDGTVFETWAQTVDRVVRHQKWLWERAQKRAINFAQGEELEELRELLLERKGLMSGRTLWLGGTDVAKRRMASQVNCSFKRVATVHDVVDIFWLLLQGAGTGFEAVPGTLNGFSRKLDVQIIRSTRTLVQWAAGERGDPMNHEFVNGDTWTIQVGDSAEAWAKAVGKVMAGKAAVKTLVIDLSAIRASGVRLKGYGWVSSGDGPLSKALEGICTVMNHKAGQLLNRIDLLDVLNWLGTTLSSRRSAQIALCPAHDAEADQFASAKKDYWTTGNIQRGQSNNSLVFWHKPSKHELRGIFQAMIDAGGSEPGFINGLSAQKRAPWFAGGNPCMEQLLGDGGVCNLSEIVLPKFNGDVKGLMRAARIIARANYRQTCIDMRDGVLQHTWHELNEFLHLCGVGVTGVVQWDHSGSALAWRDLADTVRFAAHSMADELGLPYPKHVTTVKPSGTLSKIADVSEGVHAPLGRFIFNNVSFGLHDPLIPHLKAAGYFMQLNPLDPSSMLVRLPTEYPGAPPVNTESAIDQLERYKLMMENYVDSNCSVTISYDPSESKAIVDWLHANWDTYVGVSFIYRNDPTKTAADLGYAYLPQEVVTEEVFRAYADSLLVIDVENLGGGDLVDEGCASGACPIR